MMMTFMITTAIIIVSFGTGGYFGLEIGKIMGENNARAETSKKKIRDFTKIRTKR